MDNIRYIKLNNIEEILISDFEISNFCDYHKKIEFNTFLGKIVFRKEYFRIYRFLNGHEYLDMEEFLQKGIYKLINNEVYVKPKITFKFKNINDYSLYFETKNEAIQWLDDFLLKKGLNTKIINITK